MKKIVEYATNEGFTNLLVFNEDQKHVNGLLMVHLPDGPTAHFKLSSVVMSKQIRVRPAACTCQVAGMQTI